MGIERIKKGLCRQIKALSLLHQLQVEEYEILRSSNKTQLSNNQFSIQALLKQILKEREHLKRLLREGWGVDRLSEIQGKLPEGEWEGLEKLLSTLREMEERCSIQSTRNADLAIAHLEQTRELVQFLYDKIKPKEKFTYSRYGKFEEKSSGPYIINGRL